MSTTNNQTSSELTVRLAALTVGGACIGEAVSESDQASTQQPSPGKKIFIRETAPGELVTAQIVAEQPNYLTAKVSRILQPSPARVAPPCPLFGRCGGCDLQHIEISAQRLAKLDMIKSMLQKHAGLDVSSFLQDASDNLPAYNYRYRCELHLDLNGQMGFYASGTGTVVDCKHCLLLVPSLSDYLARYGSVLRSMASHIAAVRVEALNEAVGSEVTVVLKLRPESKDPLSDPRLIEFVRANRGIKIIQDRKVILDSAQAVASGAVGHFSQVNQYGNKRLQELVREYTQGQHITELYAGAGNFTFPLAATGANIDAVESEQALVQAGNAEAARLGITDRVRFFALSSEKYVRTKNLHPTVLLDPPRSGAKFPCKAIAQSKVTDITYVSCNLASFTRDLQILSSSRFKLTKLAFVDMFPQTHHVELVAKLERS